MGNVRDFLLNNVEVLKDAVRELNSWDGSMEHLDVHENDEDFFNTYFDGRPAEAVRASYYGEYNYMDEYVRFDGYGNLESLTDYQYEQKLKDEVDDIIGLLVEEKHNLNLDGELEELLDEDEEDED